MSQPYPNYSSAGRSKRILINEEAWKHITTTIQYTREQDGDSEVKLGVRGFFAKGLLVGLLPISAPILCRGLGMKIITTELLMEIYTTTAQYYHALALSKHATRTTKEKEYENESYKIMIQGVGLAATVFNDVWSLHSHYLKSLPGDDKFKASQINQELVLGYRVDALVSWMHAIERYVQGQLLGPPESDPWLDTKQPPFEYSGRPVVMYLSDWPKISKPDQLKLLRELRWYPESETYLRLTYRDHVSTEAPPNENGTIASVAADATSGAARTAEGPATAAATVEPPEVASSIPPSSSPSEQ